MKAEILIEWPKGTRTRWEKVEGRFVRLEEDAPAPVNYGFIPGTQNPADGSELDAVLLGPPVPAGKRVRAAVVGAVALADGDHKLVLARDGKPPSEEEIRTLLAWFPRERTPRLLSAEEAHALLLGMLRTEGGNDGDR